ncbi:MAG: DUF3098 domain-containing protein [Bacteroidales bacterium]|nr:DUF3098 domain-containing protein [Bacteroidales bacterium]
MNDKQKFAFNKINFILIAIGLLAVIIGFFLMSGPVSTEVFFESDIFSVRRIKIAPAICFLGYIFMIYGILHKPKIKE